MDNPDTPLPPLDQTDTWYGELDRIRAFAKLTAEYHRALREMGISKELADDLTRQYHELRLAVAAAKGGFGYSAINPLDSSRSRPGAVLHTIG
jgi:hypothetical protein